MSSKSHSGLEIISARLFNYPRSLVFEAFSNPKHLVQWWGPKGFTNTFSEFEFRPGGMWRFVMHGPDGKNYENESQFVEVIQSERIVFDHLKTMHQFRMTMTFLEQSGKTNLAWNMQFESGAGNENLKNFIIQANEQNFDRLQNLLDKSFKNKMSGTFLASSDP